MLLTNKFNLYGERNSRNPNITRTLEVPNLVKTDISNFQSAVRLADEHNIKCATRITTRYNELVRERRLRNGTDRSSL